MYDVVVLGAGLAGLCAARDLVTGGADVAVLEARERVGGRVLQRTLPDGRVVQLGGELIGDTHTAYLGLVRELGLSVRDGYVSEPGATVWDLDGTVSVGDPAPWMSVDDHADYARVVQEMIGLAKTVDLDDPWSHPQFAQLDATSLRDWLQQIDARPAVLRMFRAAKAGLAADSTERTSLLAELRKLAVAGDRLADYYDIDQWTRYTVAEGSASVALRMADQLGARIRLGAVVQAISVRPDQVRVTLAGGEEITARNVVCAIPVAPLRQIAITGLSQARLQALRGIRNSLTAKIVAVYPTSFWRELGRNGSAYGDGLIGSTWVQGPGVLSALVPPEQLSFHLAGDQSARDRDARAALVRLYGPQAAETDALITREWSGYPYTFGYMAHYAPGDLTAIGPLHARHEPPFYVAGSDFWVAGYMEGAVRTGRSAASAVLGR